jgi:oligopeptide/dipeptide ABC transporter ATP-binding protein
VSALLEVRGLVTRYRARARGQAVTFAAVDGVSFDLERGRALGLVGESGSGKSTVARTIVGLERAAAGSVTFGGVELTSLSPRSWRPYRRRIQLVFQDPYASLDPRQTIGSALVEPLAIHGLMRPRERRIKALATLESVGLDARHFDRYPHEFSGGQRQRIGIARALVLEPELLIYDEPVSALDVSIQAQIVNLLAELRARLSLSYLFIAHDLAVVRHLCDDVAVMYLGRIVEHASREQLFGDPRHPYTQGLLAAVPTLDPGMERGPRRTLIAGDPGSPLDPPSGCRFHPRCPHKSRVPNDRCRTETPALSPPCEDSIPESSRRVACHLETTAIGASTQ